MSFEVIKKLLQDQFSDAILGEQGASTPATLMIDSKKNVEICRFLYEHEQTYFDFLSSVTAVDNGVEINTISILYILNSIPHHLDLILRTDIPRDDAKIDSVTSVWLGANWHEREIFDLFGVSFTNHPDMRRILMPDDWEGHPLLKDYVEQKEYHGVKVGYDDARKKDQDAS